MTPTMTYSEILADRIAKAQDDDREKTWLNDGSTDMTSTAGYDNDGSTGPDLIENGVDLGLRLADYRQKQQRDATIFFANDPKGETRYYQIGANEEDALTRLEAALAED